MKLKTNIMCGACIAKVTPVLNEKIGEGKWSVDTTGAMKLLTVTNENLEVADVVTAVEEAGYKAEALN
ncbi:MAG: heavy metal transport/detoxification protein [Ginsengibacter sp.]